MLLSAPEKRSRRIQIQSLWHRMDHLKWLLRIPGQGGHDSGMIPVTIPK